MVCLPIPSVSTCAPFALGAVIIVSPGQPAVCAACSIARAIVLLILQRPGGNRRATAGEVGAEGARRPRRVHYRAHRRQELRARRLVEAVVAGRRQEVEASRRQRRDEQRRVPDVVDGVLARAPSAASRRRLSSVGIAMSGTISTTRRPVGHGAPARAPRVLPPTPRPADRRGAPG